MMPGAEPPSTEAERLAALRSYEVLDTGSEDVFDELVALAARLTKSPIALISLVDAERQWFKARHGFDVAETHRDQAFCAYTILDPKHPLVVPDARIDVRFQTNPSVTGAPGIRAYIGVPLVNLEGHALGSLCVIDRVPRQYDDETIETMQTLARAVSVNLELRRSLLRAREAALTDSLTGLPNRRAIMAAFAEAIAQAQPVAMIAVDLDCFKEINDGEGHAVGDIVLQVAAERLRRAALPGDMVGRTGGDEFVVLLIGETNRDVVVQLARRIRHTLHQPVEFGPRRLRLGATLGISMAPDGPLTPDLALRVADAALIRAKRMRRGTIGFGSREDAAHLLRTAAIVRAFDSSVLAAKQVQGASVHLQPIVALAGTPAAEPRIIAVEALARWSHASVGEVSPGELFPAIGPERASRLGDVIREQALAAFSALQNTELRGTRVALNLSAGEVSRTDIALRIADQVERAGLTLHCVEIEITEELLLERVSHHTLEQLTALRAQGARLVLDDFGIGNSGLAQLLRLPIDGVKLDKQFVGRLGIDSRAGEIVRATVSLAHSLGLTLVVEGVETEWQSSALREFGCDAAQGFLYAKPMPLDMMRSWLDERAQRDTEGARPRVTGDAQNAV